MSAIARFLRRSPAAGLISDAVKWTRDPRTMRRLIADARATWDEAAFMRALPPAAPGARQALILSMSDWSYEIKVECMLALELRRRGWSVRILTSNVYSNARRIFAAYGLTDLVSFEKLVWDPKIYRQCEAEAARLAAGPTDFASVKEWSYRDAWIGPQILATISRKTFNGTPDPTDPAARAELLNQLPLAIGFVHAAERYFDAQRPDLILVNEPNSTLGPFVDVAIARKIPIVHFIQPSREGRAGVQMSHARQPAGFTRIRFLPTCWVGWPASRGPGSTTARSTRNSGVAMAACGASRNAINPAPWRCRRRRFAANWDWMPPSRPRCCSPHVLWDANLFYGNDLFDNYGHWFVETVKAAAANPNLNWLIKLHPANLWKTRACRRDRRVRRNPPHPRGDRATAETRSPADAENADQHLVPVPHGQCRHNRAWQRRI